MRLASGLAQVVNYMLGIYAEPPFGLHGWTDTYWGNFIYIYLYNSCIHIYVYTHTHMLVTGTIVKRDNKKYTARAASLSIKNTVCQNWGLCLLA